MAMFDVPLKVAFKAKEGSGASSTTFKLVMCPRNFDLSVLKRNVMDNFADLIPSGLRGRPKMADTLIKLEYNDAEGDGLYIDNDDELRRAISELSEGSKVPKLWLSCNEGEKPPAPGDGGGGGHVPAPSFYQKESGVEVSRASGSCSWVRDKLYATESGSDKAPQVSPVPRATSSAAKPHLPGKFKTVPCVHFQRGNCRHGADCTFIHEGDEVHGAGWRAPVQVQEPWKPAGWERNVSSASSSAVSPTSNWCQQDEFVETYGGGGATFSWSRDKVDVGFDKQATLFSAPSALAKKQVPGGNYRTVPCRHFQRGHCKNGDDCTFLHAGTSPASLRGDDHDLHRGGLAAAGWPADGGIQKLDYISSSDAQLCYWLQQKIDQPVGVTIEELASQASTADVKLLVALLEGKKLTGDVMDKLVELLTKEEFRKWEMREHTNRIYSLLLGTPFMVRFHAHITSLVQPKTRQIHPYVKLAEELLNRTRDGWKEVPLDAIKRVVSDEMTPDEESDAGFTAWRELLRSVNSLLDQRVMLKRLYSNNN